ncbi:MAG: MotA/TolQ/ExbB proton channel family protein [Planctomycetota bacterium]
MLEHIIAQGGFTLALIGLLSVIGLAVGLERTWRLLALRRRCRDSHERFAAATDAAALAALAHGGGDPLSRIVAAALAQRREGLEAMRMAGLDRAQREVPGIERGLGVLATVAQVAPLLGLFGTVVGLMQAFLRTSTAERVTAAVLSDGIFKALGTTAAGLAVAIAATLVLNALAGLAAGLVDAMERVATECPNRAGGGRQ